MEYDDLELDTLGDRKTALFLIMSDTDTTFNFVIAMLQSQLFNLLCDKADDEYGGRLPVHVRCILDEFANIGQIPNFDKLIATIRSREISASIILQSQSQLKAIYKDAAEIISDTDDTFNFVVSILYTQLFNLLCDKADDEYGGRLPVHVRCLLDEFANIGQIPKFEKLIATIRSREISASIILQSQSQLKAIYKDNADTIAGNCDTTLFLGGKEKTTLKEMSEILGKETIDSFNTSENRGREVSHGLNYQKLGKQLMTEDEIAVMDGGKCILQLRGVRPFFSDKYDITKHPNYKYLSDYDKKNTFDMEKHLRRRPALVKPDEPFDYYEISEADLQEDTDHE